MAALNTSPSLKIRPYEGDRVGIVIGIDFGTTFSGVSYAFLHPSQTPELQGVTELVFKFIPAFLLAYFSILFALDSEARRQETARSLQ